MSSSSSSRNDDDDDDEGITNGTSDMSSNLSSSDSSSKSKSDDVSTNSTGNDDTTSSSTGNDGTKPEENRTKMSTPPPKKKASWLKRLFSKSPDAIQLKRLREYNKVLREKLLRYRRQWQTSKFYERTAKNGFADIPKKMTEYGMIDCLPIVEKRHMTNLLLLNERQRIARKAGDALARRITEVEVLIRTLSETKTALQLDDSFFIDPEIKNDTFISKTDTTFYHNPYMNQMWPKNQRLCLFYCPNQTPFLCQIFCKEECLHLIALGLLVWRL